MNHEHCEHCYDIRTCALLSRDNGSCKIVSCGLNCGARFHLCKLAEHQLLCPNEKVPCINRANGCPAIVYRRYRFRHMITCPANLYMCPYEWNRRPMSNDDTHVAPSVSGDISPPAGWVRCQPDAGLAVKDSFTFEHWLENLKQISPQYNHITPAKFIKSGEVSDIFCGKFIPETVFIDSSKQENTSAIFSQASVPDGYVDKVIYHFKCGQVFGVYDLFRHIINVHQDIYAHVNSWIEHRCPLAYLGCTFSLRRLYPTDKDSYVVQDSFGNFGVTSRRGNCESEAHAPSTSTQNVMEHSDVLSSLERGDEARSESYRVCGYKRRPLCSVKSKQSVESTYCTGLLDLPLELLRHILMFLDPFSIRNAAQACKALHSASRTIVHKKGLIILDWKKVMYGDKVRWINPKSRWIFPPSFTPIDIWGMEVTTGAMAEHLKICPYYERKEMTSEPVRVMF